MISTLAFVGVMLLVEVAIVCMAYLMGHANGWIAGWEDRRRKQ